MRMLLMMVPKLERWSAGCFRKVSSQNEFGTCQRGGSRLTRDVASAAGWKGVRTRAKYGGEVGGGKAGRWRQFCEWKLWECLPTFTSGLTKCSEAIGQYTNYIRRENRKVINPSLKVFKVHVCRVTSKSTEAWSPGSGGGVLPKDTDSGSWERSGGLGMRCCQNPWNQCGGENSAFTNSKRAVKYQIWLKRPGQIIIYLCQETLTEGRNQGRCAESEGCLGGLSVGAKIIRFVIQKKNLLWQLDSVYCDGIKRLEAWRPVRKKL